MIEVRAAQVIFTHPYFTSSQSRILSICAAAMRNAALIRFPPIVRGPGAELIRLGGGIDPFETWSRASDQRVPIWAHPDAFALESILSEAPSNARPGGQGFDVLSPGGATPSWENVSIAQNP